MIVKRVCIRKSGETLPALKDAMAVEVSPMPLSILFLVMQYRYSQQLRDGIVFLCVIGILIRFANEKDALQLCFEKVC